MIGRTASSGAAALLLLALASRADAGDLSQQARQLAELRAEVEGLSTELGLEREELSARLRAMDAQRADLEVQVRREELRLQQLDEAADKQRQSLDADARTGEVLRPALAESFSAIGRTIDTGLPYRQAERRQALDDLQAQVDDRLLSPQAAAARLWAFVEDERRLARENALDRQVITLDGQERMVEVARLGMVAIFFRTEDGRVGWAEARDGAWTWTAAASAEDQARVLDLFDSLQKQIRVGWFDLPGAAFQGAAGGEG